MTNEKIWEIAMKQSAIDFGCDKEDFLGDKHKVTVSRAHPKARKYLPLPFECDMVSYGKCIIAQTSEELKPVIEKYVNSYLYTHCFETPNIHVLDEMLSEHNLKVCFMAEYFLPDIYQLHDIPCGYETRVLTSKDFAQLYKPEWSNALCKERKELDVLGVGAYDSSGKLIGLAGCSADCDDMYQIGIDVLPEYRRQGIACSLTTKLALEILKLGKVPFYCTAWCNIRSVRNAIKCGFRPAWVELTAKNTDFVNEMNNRLKLR